jgi:hypothetical protein
MESQLESSAPVCRLSVSKSALHSLDIWLALLVDFSLDYVLPSWEDFLGKGLAYCIASELQDVFISCSTQHVKTI